MVRTVVGYALVAKIGFLSTLATEACFRRTLPCGLLLSTGLAEQYRNLCKMSPRSVLITGCNRGIGLGLVRHFLAEADPPKHLIVTCRDKSKASELVQLQQKHADR